MPPSPSVSPVEVYAGADLRLPLAAALQDILRGKLGLRGYRTAGMTRRGRRKRQHKTNAARGEGKG